MVGRTGGTVPSGLSPVLQKMQERPISGYCILFGVVSVVLYSQDCVYLPVFSRFQYSCCDDRKFAASYKAKKDRNAAVRRDFCGNVYYVLSCAGWCCCQN